MHGYEMELEDLLTEYHAKQDYGAMMACLLKPALYVLQCIGNGNDSQPASPAAAPGAVTLAAEAAHNVHGTNGASGGGGPGGQQHSTLTSPSTAKNGHHGHHHGGSHHHAVGLNGSSSNGNLESVTSTAATKSDQLDLEGGGGQNNHEAGSAHGGLTEAGTGSGLDVIVNHASTLKIDKNKVPVDLRLHGYLSNLAKSCPCPCAVGSRELTIAELSADSLEDLHIVAKQQFDDHKLKAFDCNGATRSTLKKIFKGLITPSSSNSNSNNNQNNSSSTGNKNNSDQAANAPEAGEAGGTGNKPGSTKTGSKKSGKEATTPTAGAGSNNDVKNKS